MKLRELAVVTALALGGFATEAAAVVAEPVAVESLRDPVGAIRCMRLEIHSAGPVEAGHAMAGRLVERHEY